MWLDNGWLLFQWLESINEHHLPVLALVMENERLNVESVVVNDNV